MKHFLTLETSMEQGSLGLFRIEKKQIFSLSSKHWLTKNDKKNRSQHSQKLPLEIEISLKETNLSLKDLDFFAVGIGPGRFTGVRTAINIIRTLAFTLKKPCYVVNSLRLAAEAFLPSHKQVSVAFNAFRDSVYFASFTENQTNIKPKVLSFSDWLEYMKSHNINFCIGDVPNFYDIPKDLKQTCTFQQASIKAEHLAQVVYKNFDPKNLTPWFRLEPLYLSSVAKQNT